MGKLALQIRRALGRLRVKLRVAWQLRSVRRIEKKLRGLARAHEKRAGLLGRIIARHSDLEARIIASDLVELWRDADTRLGERNRLHPTIDPGLADDSCSFVGAPFDLATPEASAAIKRFAWLDVLLARGFQLLLAKDGANAARHANSPLRARIDATFVAVAEKAVSSEKKALLRKLRTLKAAVPGSELWQLLPALNSSRRDEFGRWRQSIEAALITLDPERGLLTLLNQTCIRNTALDIAAGIYAVHLARRAARRTIRRTACLHLALYVLWFTVVFCALRTAGVSAPASLIPSALWLSVVFPVRIIIANIRYQISCMASGARRVLAPPATEGDFVLFLRAFATDDELVEDRTPFEYLRMTSWLLPTMAPFRMRLIKSLGGLRRVIAIADPAHRNVDGDYGLVALPESRWQHNVRRAAAQATLIVVDLNDCRSPGFQWELDAVLRPEYAEKLVFVMPFGPRRFFGGMERRWQRIGDQVVQIEEALGWSASPPPSRRGFHLLSPPDRYEVACRAIRERLADVWLPRFSSESLFMFFEQGHRGRLLDHQEIGAAHLEPLRREFSRDDYAPLKIALLRAGELMLLIAGQRFMA